MDLHFKSAAEIARLIRERKISAIETLEHFLARVEKYNPRLNAIIWLDAARARERARAADAALAKGEIWGPLHGVPMTIKESYNVAGSPTTWGDPDLKNNVTETSALAVERLEKAGVVLFGKTNVPLLLADHQSFNAIYGTTNNPWDLARTPGGSSGGSAAALAAGLTGIEAGSDIGGSIRIPAHFCGVFGLKPTWGVAAPKGQALPGSYAYADMSVIGPLARGADDLEIALNAMAGPDEIDGIAWKVDLPGCGAASLKDFRIAVKLCDPNCEVETGYADALQALADALARCGAMVKEAQPKLDTARLHEMYILLLRAATSARTPDEDVERWRKAAEAVRPGEEPYLELMVRGTSLPHRDWLRAQQRAPWLATCLRGILRGLRHSAVPGRRFRRVPARPHGRALAAQDRGEPQKCPVDEPSVLGRLFECCLSPFYGRPDGDYAVRAAGRLPGHSSERSRQDRNHP